MSDKGAGKFTPGPWEIDDLLTIYGAQLDAGSSPIVAEVWAQEGEKYQDCSVANACLVAAAWELLEALEDAVQDCHCTLRERDSGHLASCFVPKAKEAIKKAKGESA